MRRARSARRVKEAGGRYGSLRLRTLITKLKKVSTIRLPSSSRASAVSSSAGLARASAASSDRTARKAGRS